HNALLQGGLIEPPLMTHKLDELIAAERLIISSHSPLCATLSLLSQYQISTVIEQRIAANKPTLLVGAAVHAALAGGGQFDWLGLDVLPGVLTRFQAQHNDVGERVKAPHLGWNALVSLPPHPLWAGISEGPFPYFAYQYYVDQIPPAAQLA